jgi:hypothetical protein
MNPTEEKKILSLCLYLARTTVPVTDTMTELIDPQSQGIHDGITEMSSRLLSLESSWAQIQGRRESREYSL